MKFFVPLLLILSPLIAQSQDERQIDQIVQTVLGEDRTQKFSLHEPLYAIAGDDDLKLQFSFKYRMAENTPLYFSYAQLMFWKIYEESKPFEDLNYRPEVFYRLVEAPERSLRGVDMGWGHVSNGQAGSTSRSVDRVFVRGNYVTKLEGHTLALSLQLYHVYNEDKTNKDIVNHLGYWNLSTYVTDILSGKRETLDFEFKVFAGSKVIDFDQGGYQIGLIYNLHSSHFNPSIYLQRYEGFAEDLLSYDSRRTEHRLGLLLTF